MARGEKTITFDFPITYSYEGVFTETNTITVRAPGLAKYDVHATMVAYTAQAMNGFVEIQSRLNRGEIEDESEEAQAVKNKDVERDVMQLMAMGLGVAKYPEFALYVKKILTNAPKLATVGEHSVALTEEVWMEIEREGGVEAANRIFSEFSGFFFDALGSASPKTNGTSSQTGSASPAKATSPTKSRANSRLNA